jgi:hypothetical protein
LECEHIKLEEENQKIQAWVVSFDN